jgi:hypothetical protein
MHYCFYTKPEVLLLRISGPHIGHLDITSNANLRPIWDNTVLYGRQSCVQLSNKEDTYFVLKAATSYFTIIQPWRFVAQLADLTAWRSETCTLFARHKYIVVLDIYLTVYYFHLQISIILHSKHRLENVLFLPLPKPCTQYSYIPCGLHIAPILSNLISLS